VPDAPSRLPFPSGAGDVRPGCDSFHLGHVAGVKRTIEGEQPVKVKDIWDIFGALILVAIIAVILTKKNTARDVTATGHAFTGALSTAERG
jgi:hypothetical protein